MKTAKCKTTHYACDCVLGRMVLLEKVAKAAELFHEKHIPNGCQCQGCDLGNALAALREREGRE